MALADVVVVWGTNAASTQVNVLTHVLRARRERNAKIVVIDTYNQRHRAPGRSVHLRAPWHRRRPWPVR